MSPSAVSPKSSLIVDSQNAQCIPAAKTVDNKGSHDSPKPQHIEPAAVERDLFDYQVETDLEKELQSVLDDVDIEDFDLAVSLWFCVLSSPLSHHNIVIIIYIHLSLYLFVYSSQSSPEARAATLVQWLGCLPAAPVIMYPPCQRWLT